jgi:hypothetical protein
MGDERMGKMRGLGRLRKMKGDREGFGFTPLPTPYSPLPILFF